MKYYRAIFLQLSLLFGQILRKNSLLGNLALSVFCISISQLLLYVYYSILAQEFNRSIYNILT
ncbi:MAG: hypothetical protein R2772_11770, partial [Chitinophagales bacterium]